MQRIICAITISYILGIIVSNAFSIEHLIMLLFILTASLIIKSLTSDGIKPNTHFVYFLPFLIGILMFQLADDISLREIGRFVDKPITFTGKIINNPKYIDNKIECLAKISEVAIEGERYKLNEKVRVVVRLSNNASKMELNYKDMIIVQGKLTIPSQEMNTGGFNYNQFLKSQGIFATTYVSSYGVRKLENKAVKDSLIDYVYYIRQQIIKTIDKSLPYDEAALLKAMTAGDRYDFSEEMQDVFKKSGLSHIVAVSGMHVAILIGGAYALFKLFRINKGLINLICIVLVIVYVLITGASPSVVRAGIMTSLFLISYLINREADTITSLFLAGLLMLLFNPIILFNAGFQLSFCSTFALLIFCRPLYNKLLLLNKFKVPKGILALLSATITAQIGTLPLVAYHFNGVSLVSLLSNIVVVPMTSAVLIGGIILVIVGNVSSFLLIPVAGFVYITLKVVLMCSKFFANLPFSYIAVKSPGILFSIIYLLMIIMLYNLIIEKRNYTKIKFASAALFLIILLSGITTIIFSCCLRVTFINVGQGDAILVQSPGGKTVLIDGGGAEGEEKYDVGNNILLPFLIKRGITSIDIVAVTHYHADHAKGIVEVLENIKSNALILPYRDDENILYKKLVEIAKERGISVYFLSRGDNIFLSKYTQIDVLSPSKDVIYLSGDNHNNKSMVLRLKHGKTSFVFTGDIERLAEEYLLKYPEDLDSNVLKVAHHGSDTSSYEGFIKAVSPEYAAISVGVNNFGHPSVEVLDRLENECYRVYRTDKNGTINFFATKSELIKISVLRGGE